MRGTYLFICLATLLFCGLTRIDGRVSAQSPSDKPSQPFAFYGEGFVLLQHGNVLHGFVKPHAERVTVVLEKGNEVSIPNRQILTIGKSKEALYTYQVRAIRRWGTGEHWHLAHWCIQNGLLDEAIEHYSTLEKTVSDSPKFKQLDLQLRQALLADSQVQQALAESGIANPIAPATYLEPAPTSLDEPSNQNSDRNGLQANSDNQPARILPGYVRRSFQTDVMPIVVKRCGQSGCHGILAKNDFQIFQPVGDQAALISQKNLEVLMRYVDATDPIQTSLVQYATRPHGSQTNPSIHPNRDEDRVLLEKILNWLKSVEQSSTNALDGTSHVTAETNRVAPAVALIPKSAVQQSKRRRPDADLPEQDRNAKLSKPAKSAPPPVVLDASELKEIEDAVQKLEKLETSGRAARDPFDPAVFNAKYSGTSEQKVKP